MNRSRVIAFEQSYLLAYKTYVIQNYTMNGLNLFISD